MKELIGRRRFFKYLLSLGVFSLTSILGFKKDEGFHIGKMKGFKLETPEASGTCGMGLGCAGGGGECGMGLGCAGGGGECGMGLGCAGGGRRDDDDDYGRRKRNYDYPSGSGTCGMGLGCAGGGGTCGMGLGCAGGGGECGMGLGCAGR